jgi:5S rRNA maturation endonuclease (ribonuclease M5)
MERTEILDLMGELKLFGMRGAFDEVMANGLKRRHEPQQIIGELLKAEVAEKEARSIKYQLTIAKLPLAKDLTDFDFKGTPINAALVRRLPRPAAQCRPDRRNRLRKDRSLRRMKIHNNCTCHQHTGDEIYPQLHGI